MSEQRVITVRVANVYGRESVYPVCHVAKTLAALAGRKTFDQHHLRCIEALGYDIRVQRASLPVG